MQSLCFQLIHLGVPELDKLVVLVVLYAPHKQEPIELIRKTYRQMRLMLLLYLNLAYSNSLAIILGSQMLTRNPGDK